MDTNDNSSILCPLHTEESVTAYCMKHEQVLCMKCLLGTHKACVHEDNVDDIGNTAKRLEKEIPETIRTFEHLTTSSAHWAGNCSATLQQLGETERRLVDGIEQMRIGLIKKTNKLATDAIDIVKSVVHDQRTMVEHDLAQIEQIVEKVNKLSSHVEHCKEAVNNSLEEMIHVVKSVKSLNSEFEHTELIDRNVKIHFYVSDELQFIRKNLISFGELCIEDPKISSTGIRRGPSRVSLTPSVQRESYSDDEIDSSVFVLPSDRHDSTDSQGVYFSIQVESGKACPAPPPLPDMHPIAGKLLFANNKGKFETVPRKKPSYEQTDVQKINSLYLETSAPGQVPIPKLPQKRTSTGSSEQNGKTDEETANISAGSGSSISSANRSENDMEVPKPCKGTEGQSIPEIKLRPPTTTETLVQMSEKKRIAEIDRLSPTVKKDPYNNFKSFLAHGISNSNGSINTLRDSGVVNGSIGKIPPLPKMRKPRFSLTRRVESLACSESEDVSRHSDVECSTNNLEPPPSSWKASSLNDLSGKKTPPVGHLNDSSSSMDSSQSYMSGYSSGTSLMSSDSRIVDSSVSEQSCENDTHYVKRKQTQMRVVPRLDTETRKSVSFSLLSSLSTEKDIQKSVVHSQHSTINGVAVTDSGKLFICDTENSCLQLFDNTGTPLFDYRIKEPYSCCTIRDEEVAVTSKNRKSLCVLNISGDKIVCVQEQVVSAETEVFGVGYTKGFFGVCCGDRVVLLSVNLQHYRTVKPVVMTKKRRSKTYFNDVKFIAMDWSKLGFFIYTSEEKTDRVSCVVISGRDRPVWNCQVRNPKSLVIFKENVIVAANHKLVLLEAASGHRLREIHQEVPSHPVHMVLHDGWLYMSKKSSSKEESRNIRKIPLSAK